MVVNEKSEIIPIAQAMQMAQEMGLDLVEISKQNDISVCKIVDYGKMKYEAKKVALERKKKAKKTEIKEIRMGTKIEKHDYDVKMRHATGFIESGHNVNFVVTLFGRENQHKEVAFTLLEKVKEDMANISKVYADIKSVKNKLFMLLAPKN